MCWPTGDGGGGGVGEVHKNIEKFKLMAGKK